MKEFEFDSNKNMNDGDNAGENQTPAPVNESENTPIVTDDAKTENTPAETEETPAQAEEKKAQSDPISNNPYFSGYSQPRESANRNPGMREYPYGNQQNPNEFRQDRGNYTQNGYNQGNQQYNPYGNPQNNGYYRQNPYNTQHQYNAPQQNGGQIAYTPSAGKKNKERKPMTRGAVAVLCCLMLVLSAGAGFGGAMLAGRVMQPTSSETASAPSFSDSVTANSDPVVIYKNVEEIATSTGSASDNLTLSQVAAMVKDSVVEIVTEFNNQSMWYQYVTQGAGSGVVISEDGYIITNAHVITDESTGAVADNIIVRLTDTTEYTAKAIAYDADSDIAILKIEATGLSAAQCGNSDNLAVGEELVVVGNPLGELGGTVTNGIVSATQREIQMGGVTMSLIQTNAAVNPGNSGGGMFNMKGQLVGVVNAKSSGTGIEGLGFAIPINYALDITEQLLEYGYVRGKAMIGVSFQDVSSGNYFFYYNIKSGVYVAELAKGYNDTVLEVGDRVIAVNGKEISSSEDIKAVVSSCSVGDKITFQLYRDDKLMEVEVTCFEKVPDTPSDIQFGNSEDIIPKQ